MLIIKTNVYKRVAIGSKKNVNHVPRLSSMQLVSKEVALGTPKVDAHPVMLG